MQRSVRFPDELVARIEAVAAEQDRSFSYVVVRTLEQALGEGAPESGEPVSAPAPARASERPLTEVAEDLRRTPGVLAAAAKVPGVRPAREFVKPFRPSPKES